MHLPNLVQTEINWLGGTNSFGVGGYEMWLLVSISLRFGSLL